MEAQDNIKGCDFFSLKELMAPIFSAMEKKDEQISEYIDIIRRKDEQINRLIGLVEDHVQKARSSGSDPKGDPNTTLAGAAGGLG